MKIDFANKTVLITGGTRGIGAEMALAFLKANANVYITGTKVESYQNFATNHLNSLSTEEHRISKRLHFIKINFENLIEVKELGSKIPDGVDVLINCAGINKVNNLQDIHEDEWQNIQDINLKTPFILTKIFSKQMQEKKWGRIINIGSVFGVVTKAKRISSSCSKFALLGLTKGAAIELAKDNVLVNLISPGFIDTELTRRVLGEDGINDMLQQVPISRLGKAEEIAKIALFLASTENTFITGQNIIADGGFTCG